MQNIFAHVEDGDADGDGGVNIYKKLPHGIIWLNFNSRFPKEEAIGYVDKARIEDL